MSVRKRKQRIDAITAELSEATVTANESDLLTSKPDEALFSLDVVGSKSARVKIAAEKAQQLQTVEAQMKQLAKKHRISKVKESSMERDAIVASKQSHKALADGYDMWGDDNNESSGSSRATASTKSTPTNQVRSTRLLKAAAVGGLSYNPNEKQHEDLIAEAVAVEIRRKEVDENNKQITTANLTVDPLALLEVNNGTSNGNESDSESDSEDDDDDNEEGGQGEDSNSQKKKKRALTRAQINKKKRKKARTFEQVQQSAQERLLQSIDKAATISAHLERKEAERQQLKAIKQQHKLESAELLANALTSNDISSVPLQDELNGSLRQIIPRGIRVKDQSHALEDTGAANAKQERHKRHSKPHRGQNIKWIPKYKAPVEVKVNPNKKKRGAWKK